MDVIGDDNAMEERLQVFKDRLNEKINDLNIAKEKLDEDLAELERKKSKVVDYFKNFEDRRRARKIVLLSLAGGILSLTCSMSLNAMGLSKKILPYTTAVGLCSLAAFLRYIKTAWSSHKDNSKKIIDPAAGETLALRISASVENVIFENVFKED